MQREKSEDSQSDAHVQMELPRLDSCYLRKRTIAMKDDRDEIFDRLSLHCDSKMLTHQILQLEQDGCLDRMYVQVIRRCDSYNNLTWRV